MKRLIALGLLCLPGLATFARAAVRGDRGLLSSSERGTSTARAVWVKVEEIR